MKNAVSTERVTFRLPSDLVALIEKYIEVTEEYANRPDFIITAIRNYLDFLRGFTSTEDSERRKILQKLGDIPKGTKAEEDKKYKQKMEDNAIALDEINSWKKIYSTFTGEQIRVVIRIPIGFRKRWEELKDHVPVGNYHNFIKLSIVKLIKRLDHEIRVVLSALS